MWNQHDKIDLQKVYSSIQGILNSVQDCRCDHSSNPYQAVSLGVLVFIKVNGR